MHKKLAADLTSLAHSILQMKNKEDVFALQKKAHEVYEKLSVLAYVEEYINNTPNPEHTKEELLEKIEEVAAKAKKPEAEEEIIRHELEESSEVEAKEEEVVEEVTEEETVEEAVEEAVEPIVEEVEESEEIVAEEEIEEPAVEEEKTQEIEEEVEEVIEPIAEVVEEPQEEVIEEEKGEESVAQEDLFSEEEKKEEEKPSLEIELQDTVAIDVVADLFENAPKKSLNDKLHGDIQIGLNDRIAFVKNLFDGSQEDFNRVVSQLNTFKTEKEAKKFINKMVKPDYNWSEKEEFEERFMAIVERKFV